MVRSFFAAQTVNEFIPAERILTARINPPGGSGERYADNNVRTQFFDQLFARLAMLPGVTHVAGTSSLPALGSGDREIEIEGQPLPDPKKGIPVATGVHTPGYSAAIELPILQGRAFAETDGDRGKEAAIVTREFAAKHWSGEPAVGKRFRFLTGNNEKTWIPVVGVCGNIVQRGETENARPLVFTPLRQEPRVWMTLVLRTSADPATLGPLVRAVVQNLDQDLPLYDVLTLPAALERRQWPIRIFGSLFFSFAVIALLLAAVGLYAVVAQATSRRTREIGIRIALGATAGRIMQLVLSRGLAQLGIGLGLGLGGAYAATRVIANTPLLFRVSPRDPLVFVAVTAMLVVIGVFACWIPARRAARIAPTEALRTE
jgi:predicted permease